MSFLGQGNVVTEDTIKKVVVDVVKEVVPAMLKQLTSTPATEQATETVYTDPHQAELEASAVGALKAMPEGNIILKGRRNTQMVNQSAEKVNAINDYLQSKNQWRTRQNIR